jgi:hypothetical protein
MSGLHYCWSRYVSATYSGVATATAACSSERACAASGAITTQREAGSMAFCGSAMLVCSAGGEVGELVVQGSASVWASSSARRYAWRASSSRPAR